MAKQSAFGTRLLITDPVDTSILRVHFVGDISGPEINVETIDVTNHDSADSFAEHLAGVADAGDVTFELFFDPNDTGHKRIVEMVDERRATAFSLLLPKPSQEFVADPGFGTGVANWVGLGGWTLEDSNAIFASPNPGPGETLTTAVSGLCLLETYTIAVTFGDFPTGSANIEVLLFGVVVGMVNPLVGGTQYIQVDATNTAGTLALNVPGSIGDTTGFAVTNLSLKGIAQNATERFNFNGLITKAGVLAPVKGALKASVAIKVIGKPVYIKAT